MYCRHTHLISYKTKQFLQLKEDSSGRGQFCVDPRVLRRLWLFSSSRQQLLSTFKKSPRKIYQGAKFFPNFHQLRLFCHVSIFLSTKSLFPLPVRQFLHLNRISDRVQIYHHHHHYMGERSKQDSLPPFCAFPLIRFSLHWTGAGGSLFNSHLLIRFLNCWLSDRPVSQSSETSERQIFAALSFPLIHVSICGIIMVWPMAH